ncbi:hypothetical protein [Leifsonia sp. NPDC077715]|uniref:hypothetical protein n=1 Tax=Leifsonia sp. NPDC077715 TaxID=3155539 RepID=UPI0034280473
MKRFRVSGVVGLVALVALLAGCAAPSPASTTAPPRTPSATPTPTATAADAPTVRVPLTCDQLVPPGVVSAAFRAPVHSVPVDPARNPASYADKRVGSLKCIWAEGDPAESAAKQQVYGWVSVVPGVTRQGFENFRSGIDVGGMDRPLGSEPDTYSTCEPASFQFCGFFALTGDYALSAGTWDYGTGTYDTQSAWVAAVSGAALPAVRALPSPAPLWQPAGRTLSGADNCDDLIPEGDLAAILGVEAQPIKSDDGENALSTLEINHVVHSYWCAWSTGDAGAHAAVLPGGAVYAEKTRPADAVDVTGLGDSAYRTGSELDMIAQGGWVQVRVDPAFSDDQLFAIAKRVLADVQAG